MQFEVLRECDIFLFLSPLRSESENFGFPFLFEKKQTWEVKSDH